MNAPVLPPATPLQLKRGDPGFSRVAAAFFIGGFAIFSVLYCVQPILPLLAREFELSPAAASLALSVTTLAMAFSLILAGALSEVVGRKRMMIAALTAASAATLACAAAPDWSELLALRVLTGLALSGLPAVAMAYLADEIAPVSLGFAMGLYISGSTIGGMIGRMTVGALADHWNWRVAIAAIGVEGLAGAVYFVFALPRERNFSPRAPHLRELFTTGLGHFRDPGLRLLFAQGFLVMGAFVCAYNYYGFRLAAPPFSMSPTAVGLVFLVYVFGAASSTVMGELSGRFGRRRVLWTGPVVGLVGIVVTLPDHFATAFLGLALLTWGFFAAHSISSSWVGLRATRGRAQAAALYLLFYYLGSSFGGSAGGLFYQRWGWNGVAALIAALLGSALLVARRLARVPPPAALPQR
jgi:YNFM family putative membrane transporter